MRTFVIGILLAALAVSAQAADVPASATTSWVAPTTAVDGSALTGAQAVTGYKVYADIVAVPDVPTASPVVTVDGATQTALVTLTVANNATLHIRVAACNVGGCGALSPEATKVVSVPVPGVPTQVTIAITIKTS
jgi:hypothetical protein